MTKLRISAVVCLVVLVFPAVAALQAQELVEVEHKSATVLKVVGRTVIIRGDDGVIKKYTAIPEGVHLYVDGKPAMISDLREGMKLNAVRFEDVSPPSTITIEEVAMIEEAIVEEEEMIEEEEMVAEEEMVERAQLPKTGSNLPLSGQAGLALLLLGSGIAVLRRF